VLAALLGLGCVPPPGHVSPSDGAPGPEPRPDAPVARDAPRDAGATEVSSTEPEGDAGADAGVPGSTTHHVRVHDVATGKPLPAKLFLRDEATGQLLHFGNHVDGPLCMGMAGSLRELGTGGALATWNGIALWNGEARIPIGAAWDVPANGCMDAAARPARRERIPFGRYAVVAARGLEYELTNGVVDLSPGRGEVSVDLPLARTVDTRGYLAADMHIHSGGPDGTVGQGSWDSAVSPESRVKTGAVAGVEVLVSSDHNYLTDLSGPIGRLWPSAPPVVSIVGDEVSANFGHFNAMPVTVDATRPGTNGALSDGELSAFSPKQLFARVHALPTAPMIQLNHPRLPFSAYFNDGRTCDWRDRSQLPRCALDFEAIEVLNGWLACGAKVHETLEDWYALTRFGVVVTATGNSDTHGSSAIEAGFPRTYVRVVDDGVAAFDEDEFIGAVRGQRAVATTGPFLTLRAGGDAEGAHVRATNGVVAVSLRLQSASWIKVDVLRLLVDGHVVKTWNVPSNDGVPASVFEITDEPVTITADAAITAEAEGATPLPPWMVGDFMLEQGIIKICGDPASPGMIPFAVTNPLYVDGDGDGVFRAPMSAIRAAAVDDKWVPRPPGPSDCNPLAAARAAPP
jgi:hypothetical protein